MTLEFVEKSVSLEDMCIDLEETIEEMANMQNDGNRVMRLREYSELAESKIKPQVHGTIDANVNFKIDPHLHNILPSFYGKMNEDTYEYLYEFVKKCDSYNIAGVSVDALKMRIFPHTLKDRAKDWFRTMGRNFQTWNEIEK